ncbi:tyrosine-type recombinase/integrase [Corynebacterium sp. P6129]|uniref:tyrosine-type recombinase/integrase n=1 Tax=Corynebacterium antarcticum TaxID=2800405 RepID=UPI002260DC5A|nr:site-specific integrase [Corynebacterium antarcticum]MCX7491515.1 tyrosine-type recombinase/integrase [Corynebacterium antarcticum]
MSIQRRPKTGKDKNGKVAWIARYRDATGKEHSKSFTREKDAKAWEAEQRRALRSGTWIDPEDQQITVGSLVQAYVDSADRWQTARNRKEVQKRLACFADLPVGKLRPAMVRQWVRDMEDQGLATSSVKTYLVMLKAVLNQAVRDQQIPVSPARDVRTRARASVGAVRADDVPGVEDVKRLIEGVESGAAGGRARVEVGLAIRIAANTGMRIGEVCGLRHQDVNVVAGTVTVEVQHGNRPLKTESSHRMITVDVDTMRRISEMPPGPRGEVLGGIRPQVIQNALKRARAAGLWPDRWSFHSLRHFHATQLLRAGVPVRAVSARLGHAKTSMTLDTYTHVMPGDDGDAAEIIAGLMRDKCGMEGRSVGGLRSVK